MHLFTAPRTARLGHVQARQRTGLGAALGPLQGLLKGPFFWTLGVCIPSPKLSLGQLTPTTSLPPSYHPGHPTRTPSQQHVVKGLQLPIGRWPPSFPEIGPAPAAAPPSADLRWYSPPRLRRDGKVQRPAARGRCHEEQGSLWNVSFGSPGAGRRGLERIGRERRAAAPD